MLSGYVVLQVRSTGFKLKFSQEAEYVTSAVDFGIDLLNKMFLALTNHYWL